MYHMLGILSVVESNFFRNRQDFQNKRRGVENDRNLKGEDREREGGKGSKTKSDNSKNTVFIGI